MNNLLVDWLFGLTTEISTAYVIYSWLIQSTIYLSITALFIILFKMIFKNRLKAKWHFLIWSVLLVRLLIPTLPSSPVSVFNTVKIDEDVVWQSSVRNFVTYDDSSKTIDDSSYTIAEGLQTMADMDKNPRWIRPIKSWFNSHKWESDVESGYNIKLDYLVTYIWLSVTILLSGHFITVLAVHRHRLKKTRRECDKTYLLDECKERLNIKRKVQLYYANTMPMLIGLFKPAIYISDNLSEEELEATLLHELNHLKHMDILWSATATVVLCLNWFNPIIWFSFFLFKRDLEVYCDERTLRYTENKQSYAMLLLKTATANKERFVLGTTSLQSGKADVKRRIRFMAKYKKLKTAETILAVVLISTLLVGCLTNADVLGKKTATIESPANGCKMEIVLNKSFAGDDYLTGDGTSFKFNTDKTVEEIADSIISDNPEFGILYQDDKQALLLSDIRESYPYLLLTKKVSDKNGNDVENVVFLESLGTNTYLYSYTESLRKAGNYTTEKKYSYYFPEHLRADYRYTNYEEHSYEVEYSNPFDDEVELIHRNDNFTHLINFYRNIPIYRIPDIEIRSYDNGDGEITVRNSTVEPAFKIFYNAKRNTVKYTPYSPFAAESVCSVIYRLENAIQRQDSEQMGSCLINFTDDDYINSSTIKPDFEIRKIFVNSIDNVNLKYTLNVHAMIDYNNGMDRNKHIKQFVVEFIGEEPRITYTNLFTFDENAVTYESD